MDKSFQELEDNFKTYSGLTLAQGQIRVRPGTKNNIRPLMQWVRDKVRTGNDPTQYVFVAGVNTALLIKRYHTHQAWLSKATEKANKTAKPKQFTDKVKWMDWKDSFENFLHMQAGRNGVPLSYIIRSNDNAIIRANAEFLDDYVNQAPLNGEQAYASDASEVHTYIMNFITENPTAEKKILPYLAQNNGRLVDYNALKDHYEGIGANAKTLVEAEHHATSMFY